MDEYNNKDHEIGKNTKGQAQGQGHENGPRKNEEKGTKANKDTDNSKQGQVRERARAMTRHYSRKTRFEKRVWGYLWFQLCTLFIESNYKRQT
jgi:hypothetical protein